MITHQTDYAQSLFSHFVVFRWMNIWIQWNAFNKCSNWCTYLAIFNGKYPAESIDLGQIWLKSKKWVTHLYSKGQAGSRFPRACTEGAHFPPAGSLGHSCTGLTFQEKIELWPHQCGSRRGSQMEPDSRRKLRHQGKKRISHLAQRNTEPTASVGGSDTERRQEGAN